MRCYGGGLLLCWILPVDGAIVVAIGVLWRSERARKRTLVSLTFWLHTVDPACGILTILWCRNVYTQALRPACACEADDDGAGECRGDDDGDGGAGQESIVIIFAMGNDDWGDGKLMTAIRDCCTIRRLDARLARLAANADDGIDGHSFTVNSDHANVKQWRPSPGQINAPISIAVN